MSQFHNAAPIPPKIGMLKNSAWGIGSNILQILFVSLFFAIVARQYITNDFAQFLIANTLYQLVAAFSSMGLGQWFIRRYLQEKNKTEFTGKFFKTQLTLGILFYLVNLMLTFTLYPEGNIRLLGLVLGTNIVFDNLIAAFKSLNIATSRQDKTAIITVIDGLLKLLAGSLLFIAPFSIVTLAILMIVARLFTAVLYLTMGSLANKWNLLFKAKLSLNDLKLLIFKNWRFMIIGSIAIIYWRVGHLIISKTLPLVNVAAYELSFRIFSIFQILPVIASATIYPRFIQYIQTENLVGLKRFYTQLSFGYTLIAILAYGFIFTYASVIIPIAFGNGYPNATECLQEMFLAFLVMPTVLLQANLLVSFGLEHRDMQFNLISLIINVIGCTVGVYFFQSLTAINYSIFISLAIFHLLQDIVLVKQKMVSYLHCLTFYGIITLSAFLFNTEHSFIGNYWLYWLFSLAVILIAAAKFISDKVLLQQIRTPSQPNQS